MKSLSKVLIISLFIFISGQSFAQKFGVYGGLNIATMIYKSSDVLSNLDYSPILGFNAGVTVEVGFGSLFSLETGVMAGSRGIKGDATILGYNISGKLNLLYIDVPVLLKFGPSLGPLKVFCAVGPYIGYGISGTYNFDTDLLNSSNDVKWGNTEDSDLKPLDYGIKLGIGTEIFGFTFGSYYSIGLANISPKGEDNEEIKNKVISLSVGYKIGK